MNKKIADPLAQQRQARLDRLQAERALIPVPQVIEDDPDTAWRLWQQAVAAQDEHTGGKLG